MKIYIESVQNKHINKNFLAEYKCIKSKKNYIISPQGILEIDDNNMFILKSNDFPIEMVSIDKFKGMCDKSNFIRDELWFQIPSQHIIEETNFLTYQLRPNGLVELVIEEENDQIKDFYFTFKENLCTLGWKDDILTFLSALKLC
jgi:hypothetical protein